MCWIVPAALLVLPPGLVLYQLVDLLAKPPADAWRPLVFAAALLFAGLVEWGGLRAWRLLREQQRFLDSLSGQPLSPVALNAVRIEPSGWTLERAAGGERFRWLVPRTADLPFTINRERRQVLGVTAEGVPHPMPLDGRLRWVGLTEAERLSLLAMRG